MPLTSIFLFIMKFKLKIKLKIIKFLKDQEKETFLKLTQ